MTARDPSAGRRARGRSTVGSAPRPARADGGRPDAETARHRDACEAALPADAPDADLAFGFDGFLDRNREVVETRRGPETYDLMERLGSLGERITASASERSSLTLEWLDAGERCGGHTAHLSRAFDRLGAPPTLVGTFGRPPRDAFAEEFAACDLVSVGEPTVTHAVEFSDGKLMFQDAGSMRTLDWETLVARAGLERLAAAVDGADLLGLGYWANVPLMPTVWDGLREELWPTLSDPPASVLVDPADVRQLSLDRLRDGAGPLRRLDDRVPVTVSANRGETLRLAEVADADSHFGESSSGGDPDADSAFARAAERSRRALGVTRFVGHSPAEAVATRADAPPVRAAAPETADPELTTSAGDHFNAGLVLAAVAGIDGGAALVLGNALAGWFVRRGEPPTYDQLRTFVSEYDAKFD